VVHFHRAVSPTLNPTMMIAAAVVVVAVAVAVAVAVMMTRAERPVTVIVTRTHHEPGLSQHRHSAVAVEEETMMMMADGHRAEDRQPVPEATQQMMTRQ
jgi:hypothetical protein